MKVMSLDPGRHGCKGCDGNEIVIIPAMIGTYRPLKLEYQMTKDDMVVSYQGKQYYIGNVANESYNGRRNFLPSKANNDTLVMGLATLSRLIRDDEPIHLIVGHPIANHTQIEKEKMRKLFVGQHAIEVNGRVKQIAIDRVDVVPECASCVYLLPSKSGIVHGIDVGGATTNYVTWQNGKWADLLSGTLPYGSQNTELDVDGLAHKTTIDILQRIHNFGGKVYTIGGMSNELAESLGKLGLGVEINALDKGVYANVKSYYTIGRLLSEKFKEKQQV